MDLGGWVDGSGTRISLVTETLGRFAIGTPVPEPSTWVMMAAGGLLPSMRCGRKSLRGTGTTVS